MLAVVVVEWEAAAERWAVKALAVVAERDKTAAAVPVVVVAIAAVVDFWLVAAV